MTSVARRAGRGSGAKLHSVVFGDTTIKYDVRRSRQRKKTINIRVDESGVHVAAPMRTPNRALEEMVLKRAAWILDCLSRVAEAASSPPFANGETLPYLGQDVEVVIKAAKIAAPKVRLDRRRLLVSVPEGLSSAEQYFTVQDALVGWYKARAAERLAEGVEAWWPRLGSGQRSPIHVGSARRQWGSCSSDGTLRFSWRLMMVEPYLIEYVVVHELAHLTHHNHSADFWGLVSSVMPDAKQRRKRLNEAGRLLPDLRP